MSLLDTPRVKFNHGYHDGASDARDGRERKREGMTSRLTGRRWDAVGGKVWMQGYDYGYEDFLNGDYTGNSNAAWKSRTSTRRASWMPHRKGR